MNSALFVTLLGCAPDGVPLTDEDATYHEDGLEECPASLDTELGRDALNLLHVGAQFRDEALVLEATAALAASDADRDCFRRWTRYLWIVASNGLGATVLKPMIMAGLDPNLTDIDVDPLCDGCTGSRYGMTTLHYATIDARSYLHIAGGISTPAQRVAMVRVLLEMGADPNLVCSGALYGGGNQVGAKAIGGATPLMLTASWDDQDAALEAAQMLVDAGTNLNVRALSSVRSYNGSDEVKPGDTALSIARRSGNTALVELLLGAGAIDWDLEAEERAAKSTSTEEIAEILATKQVDHNRIWTMWFDERLDNAPIETLLAAGLDPNARTWGGKYTPLWSTVFQAAVYARLPPADLRAIISAGADLNDGGSVGMPPLVVLIDQYDHHGYIEALTMLLEAGADVEGRAADGDTPLLRMMYVSRGPDTEALLLDAGADPNAANHVGQRPLSVAVRASKSLEMIDRLLARGADLNADVGGAPLWAYALEHNPLYVSDTHAATVAPILDRFVNHPSLYIDLTAPGVQSALARADSNPLVKPFADVIRARASTWP